MEVAARKLQAALQSQEQELSVARQQCKELERAGLTNASELQREVSSMQGRVKQLSLDLNTSQQANAALKIEHGRAERSWSDELSAMKNDVVEPLERRVEQLLVTTQRLTNELSDREDKVQELTRQSAKHQETILFLQSEVSSKDRKLNQAGEDIEAGQAQLLSLRRTQQQLAGAQDESRRLRLDLDTLQDKVRSLEEQLAVKDRDLSQMHDREIELVTEVSKRKSEIATIRERFANLDSLKAISDQNFAELQGREHDLLEKIEELRSTQNMMQMCFDKQQEQIELSRRLRVTESSVHVTSDAAASGGTRLQF
jgi:chromosome segregation ATPase